MKHSRLLICFLGAVTLAALVAVIWQARIIAGLRAEVADARQELRHTLAVVLDTAPASTPDQAQRERLELIKLRHESRELRESLVEARAARPTGLKGLLNPLLPSASAAPVQIRSEWKGMEQNATNNYAQAMQGVNNGTNPYVRFLSLSRAAKFSFALGHAEQARRFAEDAIVLNAKYNRGDPEKSNGDVDHDANVVLGRLAAAEARLDDAKRHLLAAGRTRGSPVLSTFGPNMGLAKDLLERGEQQTVIEYFELCRKFWGEKAKLDLWKKDIEAGRIPEFGGNLIY